MFKITSKVVSRLSLSVFTAAVAAFLILAAPQTVLAAEFILKVAIFPTDEIHHEFGRKFEQRSRSSKNFVANFIFLIRMTTLNLTP